MDVKTLAAAVAISERRAREMIDGLVVENGLDGVRYDAVQSLTEAQKARARENIGAADATGIENDMVAVKREVNGYLADTPVRYYRVLFDSVWNAKKNQPSLSASAAEVRFFWHGRGGMRRSLRAGGQ